MFVVLHLNRNISVSEENIPHGNSNNYSLMHTRPHPKSENSCLVIIIDKYKGDTKGRISLEENDCSKETNNHIMCKKST